MDDEALRATVIAPEALPFPGEVFAGRYRIVASLGTGGMGAVFRAHDVALDEDIALKVMHEGLADKPVALARFRREVKLARRVTHVNVARTYDLGVHQGTVFLTMELIGGVPLSQRLSGGPLSLSEALRVGSEIARGLTAAHAVDVVHRDLKPENVMVGGDRVVITDFGIARSAEIEGDARVTSGLVGTPAYMAPEQVAAEPLDGRTDVYALGVLLFEALSGELPFTAKTPLALAASRLTAEPPDPRRYVPRLPAPIAKLVLDMLARRREERPAAQSVLARLEELRGSAAPLAAGVPEIHSSRAATLRVEAIEASDPREAELATELGHALIESAQSVPDVQLVPDGAELVLSASVRARRERVRVRLRLEHAGADTWITSVDGTLEGELELEDAVMDAVRAALALHAPAVATSRITPSRSTADRLDPAVRTLVDAALARLEAHGDPVEVEGAIAQLEEGAKRAPDDAGVQGALAFALARRWVVPDAARPIEDLARAEELCYRAIAADPTHPSALQALGMLRYVNGDMRDAARALREALNRAPELVDANVYLARLLDESGHVVLARQRAALVERLAPQRIEPCLFRLRDAAFEGDLDAVDREAERCSRRRGGKRYALLTRSRFAAWWSDRERMEEILAEAQAFDSEVVRRSVVPLLETALGGRTDVESIERQFEHDWTDESRRMAPFGHQMAAETLLSQGYPEAAIEHLEAAAALPLIDVAWMDRCPLLAPLRSEPRFAAARAVVTARIDDMWS